MAPKKPKKKLTPYNRHVQKQMKAGKSMKQAAASWSKKSGKPKTAAKTKSRSNPIPRSKPIGGNRRMGFNTQKIMKYVRLVALGAPVIAQAVRADTMENKVMHVLEAYTGVNVKTGGFRADKLLAGWTPYLASVLATYGIPKIAGIIRGL